MKSNFSKNFLKKEEEIMNFLNFTHLYMDKNIYKFIATWILITLIVQLLINFIKKHKKK